MKNIFLHKVNFFCILISFVFFGCSYYTEGNETESSNKMNKLTLIIYMAADNDLESYAIENFNEMENSKFRNMNVLALVDRSDEYDETNGNWTDTRLYEISYDSKNRNEIVSKRLNCPLLGLKQDNETELDMGNYMNLKKLIQFAKEEYPAEKFGLIIWGHGTGWRGSRAFAIDDKTDSYMSVCDLGKALNNSGLSVIGFDTCFGCVFENLYEIKNCAEYTVACPGVTPSCGWDYKSLIDRINNSNYSSREIAEIMSESSSVKTTVIINSQLENLMTSFDNFSQKLSETIGNTKDKITVLNDLLDSKSYSYTQYPCDMYLDISAMAKLYENDSDFNLAQASNQLVSSINNACLLADNSQIGVFLIQKIDSRTLQTSHPAEYIKNRNNMEQCLFIKNNQWWSPSLNAQNGSLLDKLFY